MAGSVVCGVDETTNARIALRVASRFATRMSLRLVLVHVVPTLPSRGPDMIPVSKTSREWDVRAATAMLERTVEEERALISIKSRAAVICERTNRCLVVCVGRTPTDARQVNVERRARFSAKASKGILLRATENSSSCEAP